MTHTVGTAHDQAQLQLIMETYPKMSRKEATEFMLDLRIWCSRFLDDYFKDAFDEESSK